MDLVRWMSLVRSKSWSYFDQQEEVGILALGGGTLTLLDVMMCDVDTLQNDISYVVDAGGDDELTIVVAAGSAPFHFGVVWIGRAAA